jgi:hypothetical protein
MTSLATTAPSVGPQGNHERSLDWAYSAALFLSAFLLFQVQLILAKYFLPWFGGTPAMWTTCMFFFQSLLVVGYLYAHVVADRVSVRLQGRLHSAVLGCALAGSLFLALRWHSPLLPDSHWKPMGQAFQIYTNEVAPDGIIAVNVTNTYVDLRPVVAGIANDLHFHYAFVHDDGDGRIALYSDWMLLSRAPLPLSVGGSLIEPKSRQLVWTDDYSNLFQVLR